MPPRSLIIKKDSQGKWRSFPPQISLISKQRKLCLSLSDCIDRRLEDNTISLLQIAKFDIILSIEILYQRLKIDLETHLFKNRIFFRRKLTDFNENFSSKVFENLMSQTLCTQGISKPGKI